MATVPELKPSRTFEEQLALLEARGMEVDNREEALFTLATENYYRLSGYLFQFKQPHSEEFVRGTEFRHVQRLYSFDSSLRSVLLRYLEVIEVYTRTQIAYHFSHAYGSYGHYMEWNFRSMELLEQFETASSDAIRKNKDTPAIARHLKKYSTPECTNIPLWVLVEILSFSTLSKFYASISGDTQARIAKALNDTPTYLINHLHCMANLRNLCAHFGRIYNATLRPSARLGKQIYTRYTECFPGKLPEDHLFGYLLIMLRLLPDRRFRERLLQDLAALIEQYEGDLNLSLLGFTPGWQEFLANYVEWLPQKNSACSAAT